MNDAQLIGKNVIVGAPNWQATLEANKRDYFDLFVNRQRFVAQYPEAQLLLLGFHLTGPGYREWISRQPSPFERQDTLAPLHKGALAFGFQNGTE